MEKNDIPPGEARTCPFCAETIRQTAKICPRCRLWLSLRSFRHPLINAAVFGVPFFVAFLLFANMLITRLERVLNPAPYYSDHVGAIKILDSQMNWIQTTDGIRIYVTGVITNQSLVPWKEVEFECRFFGPDGKMVDAADGHSYFSVEPGNDSAFRVAIKPGRMSNEYSSFRVSVSSARNAYSRW